MPLQQVFQKTVVDPIFRIETLKANTMKSLQLSRAVASKAAATFLPCFNLVYVHPREKKKVIVYQTQKCKAEVPLRQSELVKP